MKSNFNLRIAAIFTDSVIIHLLYSLAMGFTNWNESPQSYILFSHTFEIVTSYYFVFWLIYLWLSDIFSKGTTFGKWIFKIRTVDLEGKELPPVRKLTRSLLKTISMGLILPALYFLAVRHAYYDRIVKAKTIRPF